MKRLKIPSCFQSWLKAFPVAISILLAGTCGALSQDSGAKVYDRASARRSVVQFFDGFKGQKFIYRIQEDRDDAPAILREEVDVYSDGAFRVFQILALGVPGSDKTINQQQEVLVNRSGLAVSATQMIVPKEQKGSFVTVSADFDWSDNSQLTYSGLWAGHVWDGRTFRSMDDPSLWRDNDMEFDAERAELNIHLKDLDVRGQPTRIVFTLDPNSGRLRKIAIQADHQTIVFEPYLDKDQIAGFRHYRIDEMGQPEPALRIKLLEKKDVDDDGTRPLQFQRYQVADGTEVGVVDAGEVRFEYHSGKVEKVLDEKAFEKIKDLLLQNGADPPQNVMEQKRLTKHR